MQIHELAALSGVSVRTLQYYDRIGIFKPEKTTQAGYRIYSEQSLPKLQEILFLKELDFPLSEIKSILSHEGRERNEILTKQLALLTLSANGLTVLLSL